MAQQPTSAKPAEPKKPEDAADSGGERTAAGSNYGDWRPAAPPVPGVAPSTAPSGIGSTPHK